MYIVNLVTGLIGNGYRERVFVSVHDPLARSGRY
jgi:hypothetical protein